MSTPIKDSYSPWKWLKILVFIKEQKVHKNAWIFSNFGRCFIYLFIFYIKTLNLKWTGGGGKLLMLIIPWKYLFLCNIAFFLVTSWGQTTVHFYFILYLSSLQLNWWEKKGHDWWFVAPVEWKRYHSPEKCWKWKSNFCILYSFDKIFLLCQQYSIL